MKYLIKISPLLLVMLISNVSAHEVNFNPVNGLFGKQMQLNYLYPVLQDLAVGPLLGYQRLKVNDAKSVNQWAIGVRMEKSPLGFDKDGFYSSLAVDLQSLSTQRFDLSVDCNGRYKGYGATFLAGYAIRENPYNIVGKFGAGANTLVSLNSSIDCEDGSTFVLTGITNTVNLGFLHEMSIGYSYNSLSKELPI